PAGTKTIDDYVKDIKLWQQRLEQARDWIVKLTGSGQEAPAAQTPEDVQKKRKADSELLGSAQASAANLIEDRPLLLTKNIALDGIAHAQPGETVDLHATNFSSNAWLLHEPPKIDLQTKSGRLLLRLVGPSQDAKGAGVELGLKGVPVDAVFARFKLGGAPPVRGG